MQSINSSSKQLSRTQSRRSLLKLMAATAVALPLGGWLTAPDEASAASSRTLRTPGARTLNVKHHGARGDGQGDDTQAIQRAINAAGDSINTTVHLPAGTYVLHSPLIITNPLRLVGDGIEATTILAAHGFHMIDVAGTKNVEIQGVTLHGAHDKAQYGFAVRATNVDNLNLHDCRITSIPDVGVSLSNVRHSWITNCQFETIKMSGIRLQDSGEGNANQDIWIYRNTFRDIVTSRNGGHAAIQSHHEVRHERITIKQNDIESHYVGIGLDSLDNSVVADNRIMGNGERGEGIAFTGSNNLITGNRINYCYAAGILQWGVAYRENMNNTIEQNICWDNSQGIALVCGQAGTIIENITVRGNRCYSESGHSPQNYGIQSYINPTPEFTWRNVTIVDNDLRGNAVGPLSLVPPSEAHIEGNLS